MAVIFGPTLWLKLSDSELAGSVEKSNIFFAGIGPRGRGL